MVRHRILETQSTEPAVGEIEVDLLAQPALGTNAEFARGDWSRGLVGISLSFLTWPEGTCL